MSGPTRVGVCSRSLSANPALRAELLACAPEVRINAAGLRLEGASLAEFLRGCDAAIVGLEPVDEALLAAAPELRVVSKYGVGLDAFDFEALVRRGVRVGWRPGVNRRAVAEFALGQLITLLRGLHTSHRTVTGGGWGFPPSRQLDESTIGILGFGQVGQELAGLLAPFGARLLAHDRRALPERCAQLGVQQVSLEALLSQSHAVSVHLPLTGRTRGLLDAAALDLLPAGAVLINTARGGIVDEDALAERLADGRLAGAAFDVFEREPPAGSPLLALPDFRASAHIAGSSESARMAMGRAAIAGLRDHRPAAEVAEQLRALGVLE